MNKIDIFNANAEFFERFNNSLEDTAKDRHDRTRFTVTGLENKVEFAVTNAAGRIKKAEDDAIANIVDTTQSVGTGKYLREGAYGLGTGRGVAALEGDLGVLSRTQFFVASQDELPLEWGRTEQSGGWVVNRGQRPLAFFFGNNPNLYLSYRSANEWTQPYLFQTDYNTRADKNNVLHSGTSTPLTTLNTSDMAQDVVDRDDVTVTSGAVYRALDELRAEIALLKGKLNE